jgi:hypothetical protein
LADGISYGVGRRLECQLGREVGVSRARESTVRSVLSIFAGLFCATHPSSLAVTSRSVNPHSTER